MTPLNDALIECVKAAGGSKSVGPVLWPEKLPDAAQRFLLDCLNDDRPQRLSPEQVVLVAALARRKGCHAYARHVSAALSYAEPQPIEPRDEVADLQRQYLEGARQMARTAARIEDLLTGRKGGVTE